MSDKNNYDLSRQIPEDVKRKVRKRVGFGCVKCGLGFYQYEHFNPDFKDAKEHNPNCITLLCPNCHALKTTHKANSTHVKKWNETPKCLEQGYSRYLLPSVSENENLTIQIGNSRFYNPSAILVIDGEPIIKLEKSNNKDEPIHLTFKSSENPNSNRIIKNE